MLSLSKILCQDHADIAHYMVFQPLINPSSANNFESFTAYFYGRKQWSSIEGAPAHLGLFTIQPFSNKNTAGASLIQENIGVHSKQNIMGSFSHKIRLQEFHMLSFGLTGGVKIITSNYSKINPVDQADNQFGNSLTIVRPDFGFGLLVSNDFYHAGISIPSLITSSVVGTAETMKGKSTVHPENWTYYLHGGYLIEFFNSDQSIELSSLAKINLNSPIDLDLNLMYNFERWMRLGLSYRTKRELLFFAQYRFSQNVSAGYCYHAYLNIPKASLSAHEVFIKYTHQILKPVNIQSPRF